MSTRGYAISLESGELGYSVQVRKARNCDEVLAKMAKYKADFFELVLLDINLPASHDNTVVNGEDLGLRIRTRFPETKIIVHTSLNDPQRISNIFKTFDPEGFLIKSDIEPDILLEAVSRVMTGNTYYSERANRLIACSGFYDIHIDSYDRKMLYHMAKGEKMVELPNYIPLSMATIERRKKNLKSIFGIPNGSTKQLLDIAREKGFI